MIDLITEKEIPNLPICAATAQKGRKNIYHRLQQHQHHAGTSNVCTKSQYNISTRRQKHT
jgi:hypothetical protein